MKRAFLIIISLLIQQAFAYSEPLILFPLPPHAIAAALDKTTYHSLPSTPLPLDVTFGCADLKYDGQRLVFCECGDSTYCSLYNGNFNLNGSSYRMTVPLWGLLWHTLSQLKLPIYLVGPDEPGVDGEVLKKLGGRVVPSCEALRGIKKPGIVLYRSSDQRERDGKSFEAFKAKNPDVIVVNRYAREVFTNKNTTYELLKAAGREINLPATRYYPMHYTPQLAEQIKRELPFPRLVVKPIDNSFSYGVNVVSSDQLSSLLTKVLRDRKSIPRNAPINLACWGWSRQAKTFMVSEHVASKPYFHADEEWYNPTLRAVYVLYNDGNRIGLNILGMSWRIPGFSLSSRQSLSARHVTTDDHPSRAGLMIAPEDEIRVRELLTQALVPMYVKLLTNGPTATLPTAHSILPASS